jgi:hypothetical protein
MAAVIVFLAMGFNFMGAAQSMARLRFSPSW